MSPTETRILVCGSRNWTNQRVIGDALKFCAESIEGKIVVIHGAARGADELAGKVCKARKIEQWPMPADWDKDGKKAGPIRNSAMIALKPHVVICFSTAFPVTPGSADLCRKAEAAGIPIFLRVVGRRWRYFAPKR